ncbi:MAG: hypothetical protein HYT71_04165 [Candidatus Aenigmarchaeota archaeon]|nr:hypothetical protein [Candidatus Aenigmarchaeota archaeon]
MKPTYLAILALFLLTAGYANAQNAKENQAAIMQAEKDINEMYNSGFGVVFVSDALLDAKKAFNATIYSVVFEKTSLISERKLRAYNISDSIGALKFGIEELETYNLNTSRARELLNKSAAAFRNERYDEAENLVKQGYTELTSMRAEATLVQVRIKAVRENIISFLVDNKTNITMGAIVLVAAVYLTLGKISAKRIKNRIKDLETEKIVLKNLMKKAQYEHFQKGTLPKESYGIKMGKYKERMLEIKELVPVLKARLGKK